MNAINVSFSFLLALAILSPCVNSYIPDSVLEMTPEELGKLGCRNVMMKLAKRGLIAFSACRSELKVKDWNDLHTKINCLIKCTMGNLSLLEDNGTITQDKLQEFLNSIVPIEAHAFAHGLVGDCVEVYV